MLSYIDWMDKKGFWVRDTWDETKKRMKGMGKMKLFTEQRRILSEALSMNEEGMLNYETVLFSAIKKSGKTAVGSSVGCWYAEEGAGGSEIFVIANTLEQGEGRLMRDIKYHFEQRILDGTFSDKSAAANYIKITQYRIDLPNGTFIQALGQSYKSVAGSRHALTLWDELWGTCLVPTTKVLKKDLTWTPVGDLVEGDEIISFDENKINGNTYRNWKNGKVISTGRRSLPCQTITLSNGKTFIATQEHPWLVRRKKHNSVDWVRTDELKVGYRMMKVLDEWETREDYDAGALGGEGSLSYERNGGARLCFSPRPNVMWDAKDMIITRKSQIMKILGSCRPKRLLPKFNVEKLGRQTAIDWTEIVDISDVFDAEVVALTTDTATYISEGYCSHNTSELDRRVWDEMVPIPTVNNSLRFISTYAGFENESELLWEMYLRGVGVDEHEQGRGERIENMEDVPCWKNGNIFTYWSHDPTMPWQTPEYYESAMAQERPSAFLRLHLNQWVTSQESFMPTEWVDAASKVYEANAELWLDHPFRYWPCTIAIDAGIMRDSTALTVVGYDSKRSKVGLLTHRIWTPTKEAQIDLDAVENYLLELYNKFTVASIVYDPKHLMQMMYRLKQRGFPVKPFQQTVPNMTAASQLLFDLFKNRNVEMYPAEDLRKHLQMAVAETTSQGFRIVKNKVSKRHFVDGAVSMAMACYEAVSNGGVDISIPVMLSSPFSDMTVHSPRDVTVPFPFQD